MDGLVQQAIEGQLLSVAQRVEDQLDDQLHALDKLDADDYEALRERRLQARHSILRVSLPTISILNLPLAACMIRHKSLQCMSVSTSEDMHGLRQHAVNIKEQLQSHEM